jgi:hypothetical protein
VVILSLCFSKKPRIKICTWWIIAVINYITRSTLGLHMWMICVGERVYIYNVLFKWKPEFLEKKVKSINHIIIFFFTYFLFVSSWTKINLIG